MATILHDNGAQEEIVVNNNRQLRRLVQGALMEIPLPDGGYLIINSEGVCCRSDLLINLEATSRAYQYLSSKDRCHHCQSKDCDSNTQIKGTVILLSKEEHDRTT